MNTPHAPRVAIYARISQDASGEGAGVERQVTDARDLAERHGWRVVAEHTDNDISAMSGRARPGYENVLRLVESRSVDYVVVWQLSRLFRNRVERANAIDLFKRAEVGIMTVKGQDLDLSTAYGRGMAGLLGEFDTMESEVKSERVAAAAAHRARAGRPNGNLGYGWTRRDDGSYVEEPEQSAVVREIVSRLLEGQSLLGVTADLNQRSIPAPNSASWGKTSVKKVAVRASNAGIRIHHRGRPSEEVFAGNWPPLVSRDDWQRVNDLLIDNSRRSNTGTRPGARKHLVSWGIGECGVCGSKLRVAMRGSSRYGVKKALYVCDSRGQCVGRDEVQVDALVREVVCARMALPDATDWLLGDEDEARAASDRAASLRTRLDRAAAMFAEGEISDAQLSSISKRLQPQIAAAEEARWRSAPPAGAPALQNLVGSDALARWDGMTVASRRTVLESLELRVIVDRVKKKGPGFDPESVRIVWGPAS